MKDHKTVWEQPQTESYYQDYLHYKGPAVGLYEVENFQRFMELLAKDNAVKPAIGDDNFLQLDNGLRGVWTFKGHTCISYNIWYKKALDQTDHVEVMLSGKSMERENIEAILKRQELRDLQ